MKLIAALALVIFQSMTGAADSTSQRDVAYPANNASQPTFELHRSMFPEVLRTEDPTWPRRQWEDQAMGYGEIGLDSMAAVLQAVKEVAPLPEGGSFWDLGSGRGRAIFAVSALEGDTGRFARYRGIELNDELHGFALEAAAAWDQKVPGLDLSVTHGDFLKDDWSEATLVLCVSTLFGKDLIAALAARAARLAPGAIFVSVTHHLTAFSDQFEILSVVRLKMSWSSEDDSKRSYIFIQRRK